MSEISIVTTVLNDRKGCEEFIEQMKLQTLLPSEIVIVDGGSKDGTWDYLVEQTAQESPFPIQVHQEVGCNVARGRDVAIEHANYDLIVSTDVGCEWHPNWIEELVSPMVKDPELEAVMGSWEIDESTLQGWGKVEAAWLNSTKFIGTPESHASSRSIAYTRDLWKRIGGYPQDLTLAADDMVFALLLHKVARKTAATPVPRVKWGRHSTLKSYTKEARRNFFGAGEAGIWQKDFFLTGIRLFAEIFFLLFGAIFNIVGLKWLGIPLVVLGFLLVLLRVSKLKSAINRLEALGEMYPLIKLLTFEYLTKWNGLKGYAAGYLRGLRNCQDCRNRLKALAAN
jgi:glycosyltransferase involved in cell wall biosynthesis